MLRRVPLLIAALTLCCGLPTSAFAQDASPVASPVASRDFSLLTALGLPEINLVATADAVTGLPETLEAGRYLVSMENQTTDQEVEPFFVQLPDDVTPEQATADLNNTDDFPSWTYDAVWAGGPNAYAGQTDSVVIDLGAGDWWVGMQRLVNDGEGEQPESTSEALTVTGEAPAVAAPESVVSIPMIEYAFEIPDGLTAGPQLWSLEGAGEQPHFMVLFGVPAGTTMSDVMEVLLADPTASPAAGTPDPTALSFDDLQYLFDTAVVSTGQAEIIQVDLAPGTYAALCFVNDEETGAPHAAMGMVTVFTVS